jgi:hypothetical protein
VKSLNSLHLTNMSLLGFKFHKNTIVCSVRTHIEMTPLPAAIVVELHFDSNNLDCSQCGVQISKEKN